MGGSKFLILNPCVHPFCKVCMRDYCDMMITNGNIEKLKCPYRSGKDNKACTSNIREKDLVFLGLSEENLEKFNKFSFSKAIDTMDEYGWCPNCNSAAEIE